jgi:uncharacterized protein YkwD
MPKSHPRKGRRPYRPRPLPGSGAATAVPGDTAAAPGGAARPRPDRPAAPAPATPAQARSSAGSASAPGRPVTQDVAAFQRRIIGSDAWLRVIEDRVVSIVNDERCRRGLRPLRHDDRLRRSARAHSDDMAARSYFAHIAPDGRSPDRWMHEAGYPAPAAENIACGQPDPQQVMMNWMNSPRHRANIMHPAVRAIGVGVRHGPGGPWWTQHFGWE